LALLLLEAAELEKKGLHPFFYGAVCVQRNSANKGDYFMAKPYTVFKHCRRNMRLVTEHTELIDIDLDS
jgi:hypothetical protein